MGWPVVTPSCAEQVVKSEAATKIQKAMRGFALKCRSETRTHGSAICYAHMRARRGGCRSAKLGLTFAQNLMEKKEICRSIKRKIPRRYP